MSFLSTLLIVSFHSQFLMFMKFSLSRASLVGSVVKNLPVSGGDVSSIPDPGTCPHALEHASLCAELGACALELTNPNSAPAPRQEKQREQPVHSCSLQLEKPMQR